MTKFPPENPDCDCDFCRATRLDRAAKVDFDARYGAFAAAQNLPESQSQGRKAAPVATGVLAYFPDALKAVAEVSRIGNEQHNPGQYLHWDKTKSADEYDCLARHLLDHLRGNITDDDGALHLAKVAWRSLAALQRHLDATL